MNTQRPGVLPIRAVNQYRRREVLTYLGLRYYLSNSAARSDDWVRHVSSRLTQTRGTSPYLCAHHFKGLSEQGDVEHRLMYFPGPNEALAEAALLEECGKHKGFRIPPCVFSYRFPNSRSREGVFEHYIEGLRERHVAIAKACENIPDAVVQYTDIKRFYPSIPSERVRNLWLKHAEVPGFSNTLCELGLKLIDEHGGTEGSDGNGVLTGPMFSHLIGNLVLRDLDEAFSSGLPAQYFRYVDDITLVGSRQQVTTALQEVRRRLGDLGFQLHDEGSPKSFDVPSDEWLEGRHDFYQGEETVSWITLIGDLKRILIKNPQTSEVLRRAFHDHGFRIPIRDYSEAIFEQSYLKRLRSLASEPWFRKRVRGLSVGSIIEHAHELRGRYEDGLCKLIDGAADLSGFQRKRRIPKLRFYAGRLVYLSIDDDLLRFSEALDELPELAFLARVMRAVATRNIDNLLPMGSNAAQAAAQPLRAANQTCTLSRQTVSDIERQGVAVLQLNGVPVKEEAERVSPETDLERFAVNGPDLKMMGGGDPFLRELACLHGLSSSPRHPEVLETAFDVDEDLALDAIEQLQGSISF